MATKKKKSAAKKKTSSEGRELAVIDTIAEEITTLREQLGDAVQRYNDALDAAKVEG